MLIDRATTDNMLNKDNLQTIGYHLVVVHPCYMLSSYQLGEENIMR